MYSPWARLRVGDALFTEGFSQSFRSAEKNSYSCTFGGKKKEKKKDSFRLCNGIEYIVHTGDFQMILGPRAENPLLLCLSHKWLSLDCPVGELFSPICEGSRILQMAVHFHGKWCSSKVYGNFYHRKYGGKFVTLWATSFQGYILLTLLASWNQEQIHFRCTNYAHSLVWLHPSMV